MNSELPNKVPGEQTRAVSGKPGEQQRWRPAPNSLHPTGHWSWGPRIMRGAKFGICPVQLSLTASTSPQDTTSKTINGEAPTVDLSLQLLSSKVRL